MAKDLVSTLGPAELNALMAMQLQKMNNVVIRLNKVFEENGVKDVNDAYGCESLPEAFVSQRNALLDELSAVVDAMDKIRVAQKSLNAKGE